MAFYESVVIARPELTEAQVDKLVNDLSEIITKDKGKIIKIEKWGLRSFAYKINKNKKGHYFMLNLDSAPSTISEYERQMKINEDIIIRNGKYGPYINYKKNFNVKIWGSKKP